VFNHFLARSPLIAAVAATISLSGCAVWLHEYTEELLVMPDGSGKLTITVHIVTADPQENTRKKPGIHFRSAPKSA